MPDYDYLCNNGHIETYTERMFYSTGHICSACGFEAWRKPTMVMVNWNGLKPSQGEIAPAIAEHISHADENQERVQEEVRLNQERKRDAEPDPVYS